MANEKAIMCLEDMKIKVPIPKAARQARENNEALDVAIKALKNEPHWIPVEQALPEEPFGCLVTVMDTNPMTMEDFENILPYFVGWDGEQWNDGDGQQCPFEVLAWWGLPEPYKGVTE